MERLPFESIYPDEIMSEYAQSIFSEAFKDLSVSRLLDNMWLVDEPTYIHSVNCGRNAAMLCSNLQVPRIIAVPVVVGALLHDIGKNDINDRSLLHPSKLLSIDEKNKMLPHSKLGAERLLLESPSELSGSTIAIIMALGHHCLQSTRPHSVFDTHKIIEDSGRSIRLEFVALLGLMATTSDIGESLYTNKLMRTRLFNIANTPSAAKIGSFLKENAQEFGGGILPTEIIRIVTTQATTVTRQSEEFFGKNPNMATLIKEQSYRINPTVLPSPPQDPQQHHESILLKAS